MIKKTFYNLPKEKQERIIDAILQEFSGSTAEKASINRIIKTAKISRGSFYQYFDDKVDLVEVLTKTFAGFSLDKFKSALESENGDIFSTYTRLFDMLAELTEDEKLKGVLKNLFKNLRANDDLVSEYMINRFEGFEFFKELPATFNTDNLRFKSESDVKDLSNILIQVLKNAVFNIFVGDEDLQSARKSFLRKLEIIKKGAVKE